MSAKILAWHFLPPDGRLANGDGTLVIAGKTYRVEPPIECCSRGLHYSVRPLDALQHAPGPIVCRVECSGTIDAQDDKGACSVRRVLWLADATVPLRLFACWCAEQALNAEHAAGREPDSRSWNAIAVARLFAEGKASIQDLAAARAAAWDAAWAAARAAARDAQNARLEEVLLALAPEKRSKRRTA